MRRRVLKESTLLTRILRGFQGVSLSFYMSLPGVEPVLPSWKAGVVTVSPPSRI